MSFTDHLFNLKFAVKELERNSKKCEKEEKLEKAKAKKAIQKGNMDVARIHAENAIRQKNQSVNYLRMSARVDAVASRVQSALTTRNVTQSMAGVVRAMDSAMKSMNLEKISNIMEKFEQQFEDLDVQSSYMENTMSQTTTTAVPQGDVDKLLTQVADEAGYVFVCFAFNLQAHFLQALHTMHAQIGAEHGTAERAASVHIGRIDGRVPGAGRAHAASGTIATSGIDDIRFDIYVIVMCVV